MSNNSWLPQGNWGTKYEASSLNSCREKLNYCYNDVPKFCTDSNDMSKEKTTRSWRIKKNEIKCKDTGWIYCQTKSYLNLHVFISESAQNIVQVIYRLNLGYRI